MPAKGQCTPHPKTPYTSTLLISANMESLEAALTAIESLAPRESINYSEIARNYSIERSTLRRRYQARI